MSTAEATLTLTLREAAALTGWSLAVITAAVERGDLKARRAPGNKHVRRINRTDIDAWLAGLPADT